MRQSIYNKGMWQLTILLAETLSQISKATPLSSEILPGERIVSGTGSIPFKDSGTGISEENHSAAVSLNERSVINGSWRSAQTSGAVSVHDNGHGQLRPTVKIIIHVRKKDSTHINDEK